jgi:excisionase family DNA binding protein
MEVKLLPTHDSDSESPATKGRISENRIVKSKQLLNINQLAAYLGVSVKTIYGWIYRGIIEPERVGPRLIRFDVEKVERWISSKVGNQNGY